MKLNWPILHLRFIFVPHFVFHTRVISIISNNLIVFMRSLFKNGGFMDDSSSNVMMAFKNCSSNECNWVVVVIRIDGLWWTTNKQLRTCISTKKNYAKYICVSQIIKFIYSYCYGSGFWWIVGFQGLQDLSGALFKSRAVVKLEPMHHKNPLSELEATLSNPWSPSKTTSHSLHKFLLENSFR